MEHLLTSVNVMGIPYMEVSKQNSHQVWFSIGRHSGIHTCYMHFVGLIMMLLLPAYIACWHFVMVCI